MVMEIATSATLQAADKEAVRLAYGQKLIPVQYDYVWELAGTTGFLAYLDLETGQVFVAHDFHAAERENAWLLREEIAFDYPACAGRRSDYQISLPVSRGRIASEDLAAFYEKLARLCRIRAVMAAAKGDAQ